MTTNSFKLILTTTESIALTEALFLFIQHWKKNDAGKIPPYLTLRDSANAILAKLYSNTELKASSKINNLNS